MSVYFKHNNETYEIRVYMKENEGPAERYDLMIFKDFKSISICIFYRHDNHPKFKQAWLDPEPALKYLIDLAMKDITGKRIYPYVQGKFMGLEEKKPERYLYKVQ